MYQVRLPYKPHGVIQVKAKFQVSLLATVGVLVSTFINGTCFYYLCYAVGFNIEYIYCLIFVVIVTPTDPVAVLGLLKRLKVPKRLESMIGGESLFNDGVAVVIFSVLLTIAFGSSTGHRCCANGSVRCGCSERDSSTF